MSLVEELEVTLQDFLPEEGDICLITQGGRTVAVVTRRLYRRLREHAAGRNLPVIAGFLELRAESNDAFTQPKASDAAGNPFADE